LYLYVITGKLYIYLCINDIDNKFRSNNRPQTIKTKNENAQTVCIIPDPITNRGIIYEPPYLFETDLYPNYSLLAISIRGYDYVVLEGYFRYIQKLARSLDIKVPEAYVNYSSYIFQFLSIYF
jgi:hypothetical protein